MPADPSPAPTEPARPRVVVVGMGDTGVLVATRLARRCDVVGISTKPLFVSGQELGMRLSRLRAWRADYASSFRRFRRLDRATILHGEVTEVDLDGCCVTVRGVEGDVSIERYDALVIASGATNGFWRNARVEVEEQVEAALEQAASDVAAAGSVAVVGGGPSAVSVASSVRAAHPSTAVDVYHSRDQVLAGYHPRTRARVTRHLAAQGVGLHPGHRALVPDDAHERLGAGEVGFTTGQPAVHADVVVWAVGRATPNSAWVPPHLLDPDGFVRVDDTLRVTGTDRVFAVGDVAATDPLRCSARNGGHLVVAANVRAVLAGRTPRRRFRPPAHRWGSILGVQADGMRIFTPRGGVVHLGDRVTRRLLYPLAVHLAIYGGRRRER